jgi:ATP-dependent helicase/nuclease subunit A
MRAEPLTHREIASEDLERELAVTAGAGAGKTTVLVDRFVKIARDPRFGPDRVLAITFTKKAAMEIKERAIRRFEEAGETALRRATEAAYISTIHGFAERILRERPFDARIDPAFTVITQYEQELWIEEALQTMYAREDLGSFATRLKKEFRDGGWRIFSIVREVARLMREGPARARDEANVVGDEERCIELALDRTRASAKRAELEMLECMRELEPLLEGATFTSRTAMYGKSREYLAAVRACMGARGIHAASRDAWSNTRFTGQIAEQEREPIKAMLKHLKDRAPRATLADLDAERKLERELVPLKRAIYEAAAAIDESYAKHKRSIGALDFHDLQLRAAALLADNPSVRAEYADRFRHILLDESQDTDELQYGIIESLRTPDNVLFMVGDPKQAIYEFRGANPDVFDAAVSKLPPDRRLDLPENFRSRREIISLINGFGPPLLPDKFVMIDAKADYGADDLASPAVTVVYAEQQTDVAGKKHEPVSEARPREAASVAEEIVRLLKEAPLVRDPDVRTVSWVPLRPKHIAILFRTRIAIPYFERALAERGVPYVTASGQGFYERAEVLDCIMMLRAIAQPLDDLAMAAVLRSPFVGASDADLWRLRTPGAESVPPIWQVLRSYAPLDEFRNSFRALRSRVRGLPASVALEEAIRTFGYEASLAAHEDGPAMLANLAKVRRQVRDMGSRSPLEAYDELQRTRDLLTRESMAPLVGAGDDVVVLTTIHQAKGLEWPVVCLPNLQSPVNEPAPGFSARHGALLCKAIDAEGNEVWPLSLASVREEMGERAEAEERRLLYVALTRARERLILSACVKAKSDTARERSYGSRRFNPLAFLQEYDRGTLTYEGEHDCGCYRTSVRYVRGTVAERTIYQGGKPLAATWTPPSDGTPEREVPAIVALPLSLKVTELLAFRRCPQVYRFSHILEIEENLARRAAVRGGESNAPATVSPVELGTIVHSLLERVRLDAPDMDAEVARLVAERTEELRPALSRMLVGVLSSEIGAAIRGAKRVEREWPFAMRIGGVLVEGVIDLAIQGEDGRWTVADYKSNDFSRTGRLEYLIDYYTPQLELYAMALSRAGLGEVADCALVFLDGPRVHRWAFDGTSHERWSEETVARIAARDYATSAGPKCDLCGYRKRKVCEVGRAWTPVTAPSVGRSLPTLPG